MSTASVVTRTAKGTLVYAPYMICVGSSANTFAGVATLPAPQLTEGDVRRIVREEIAKERGK